VKVIQLGNFLVSTIALIDAHLFGQLTNVCVCCIYVCVGGVGGGGIERVKGKRSVLIATITILDRSQFDRSHF